MSASTTTGYVLHALTKYLCRFTIGLSLVESVVKREQSYYMPRDIYFYYTSMQRVGRPGGHHATHIALTIDTIIAFQYRASTAIQTGCIRCIYGILGGAGHLVGVVVIKVRFLALLVGTVFSCVLIIARSCLR